MNSAISISNQALSNLKKNNIDPTPIHFTEEFCKIANEVGFKVDGCNYLNDISKLVNITNKLMQNAIEYNLQGSQDITFIKKDLKSLKITDAINKEVSTLHKKLITTVDTIENQIESIHKNLISSKNEVVSLEKKVQLLEQELSSTKEESSKDYLTQLLNRRSLKKELEITDRLYDGSKQDYAVVFFDIDHFKNVNDTYGHEAGDAVLQTFASILKKLTKNSDIVSRYGGEEFVAIINFTDIDGLYSYLKRIKNVVNKNKFIYKEHKLQLTFSSGVELRSNYKNGNEALVGADKLLYKAKNSGRNKILFWNNYEL
jgi:diguanylate cyclase (GGDEF)-like protein